MGVRQDGGKHVRAWYRHRCHVGRSPRRGRRFVTNEAMYEDYAAWCRGRGYAGWGRSGFGRAVRPLLEEDGAVRSQTREGRGYYGVRLGSRASVERADFRAWKRQKDEGEAALLESVGD